MQRVDLKDSLIWFPKNNTEYHVNPNGRQDCETVVTFKGDCEKYAYYDLTSASFLSRDKFFSNDLFGPAYVIPKNVFFMPKESLPPSFENRTLSPLLIYSQTTKQLIECKKIEVIIEDDKQKSDFNIDTGKVFTLNNCNETIKNECQILAKNIPVVIGEHPLFIEKNRPNLRFLENLYQQFLAYNTEDKLKEEYKNTNGKCHLRAQMVSLLLSKYGIDSFKVFKIWQPMDWLKIPGKHPIWDFHCAVMLIDDENNKWVWDPWVGLNKHLLTLDQWLNYPSSPTPSKLLITNRGIYGDHKIGRLLETSHFVDRFRNESDKLQYLFNAAVPNSPEPLPPSMVGLTKNNTLFFANAKQPSQNPEAIEKPSLLRMCKS